MTDPWADIPVPATESELSARRADAAMRASFYYALDAKGRCILLLEYNCAYPTGLRLPGLTGITMSRRETSEQKGQLLLRLEDGELRDIFGELCGDILTVAGSAESDEGALSVSVSRTWRWHHLLRGGRGRQLGVEQQKGLIGELLTIEALSSTISYQVLLDSWTGPLGEPKDFSLPEALAIECKAVRGVEQPFVQISSEWQLDATELESLFLIVAGLDRSQDSDPDSFNLDDLVARLRMSVTEAAPDAVPLLDSRLFAAGYRPEDDYAEYRWTGGLKFAYDIGGEFPRVEGARLPTGVERVSYRVSLSACAGHEVELDQVIEFAGGSRDN
jgi:hypothetical protein